ncbi:TIGR04222 domain-containing membrane protein [uncultured Erythrobacter sp.]|uniref:TIGR04222 domain-containing membrane protein n=1 Tax=uncultured Erythrobacter sp. TaxID=263913 RepID=UPI002614A367|nr:TIGR04222 domain-containing membrane protein [uncultured Erythrobacter sp.]
MEIFSSYSGPDFLIFYAVMLATCVAAGLWIPANLRPLGKRNDVEDVEEVAVLAGGLDRLNVAVLATLFAKRALNSGDKRKLFVTRSEAGEGDAELTVLRKVGQFSSWEAKKALSDQAERVEARLIRQGLMMDKSERMRLRFLATLPYALLFLIGLYRQQAGDALGEPTGILIMMLVITLVFGLIRFATGNSRTIAGQEIIRTLEENGSRLKRAPQENEVGYAVAIFGTGVLVGTPWEAVHAARNSGSDGGGGCGGDEGSSDGGGSGCGGGGCGGCGG